MMLRPAWTRRESHPDLVDANDESSLLHKPMAGQEGVEPSSTVLESVLRPTLRPEQRPYPVSIRLTRETTELQRQLHDAGEHFVSPPRVERGTRALGELRPHPAGRGDRVTHG